jgi:hypothetical protein
VLAAKETSFSTLRPILIGMVKSAVQSGNGRAARAYTAFSYGVALS